MSILENKKIVALGLGREGVSTIAYLLGEGINNFAVSDIATKESLSTEAQKILSSNENIKMHLGEDYLDVLNEYDLVIKSAGIPLKTVLPFAAREKIVSPTQLFFDACKGTIIGVTGTKGKSTTASAIFAVLESQGKDVVLCGNIGIPALEVLPQITESTLVVMELSSHQLQTVTRSPHIAVLQNIVPEHLDYYESFTDYVSAKENITKYQTEKDLLLYNAAYPIPYEIAQRSKAKRIPFNSDLGDRCAFVKNEVIVYKENGKEESVLRVADLKLSGSVNYQNIMPAIIIGKLFNIDTQAIGQKLKTFRGLPDRLEYVGTISGIDYYNDSLSTIPEALIAALDALDGRVQTVIAGGYDRGLDFTKLGQYLVKTKVENLILFPATGEKIWAAVESAQKDQGKAITKWFVRTMPEAVKIAKENTKQNKICLLSPASPSFGIFKDYHDRGEQFKKAVLENLA